MEKPSTEDRIDLLPSLMLFWRWKFWIIGAVLIAALASFLVVQLIDPLYESHATLLPSNSNSRDKQLEEFTYGYEIHSERLIQLLSSEIILDSLESRFQLSEHYGIPQNGPQDWDRLRRKAKVRIQFHKTRYSSVVISVADEDPVLAADIANEVGRLVNVVNSHILKVNAKQTLEAAEKDYQQRLLAIGSINDSIIGIKASNATGVEGKMMNQVKIREDRILQLRRSLNKLRQDHQIFDYGYQVNILNEEIAEARATYLQEVGSLEIIESSPEVPDSTKVRARAKKAGAEKRMAYFQTKLDDLSKVGSEYSNVVAELEIESELLAEAKESLDELRNNLEPEIGTQDLRVLEANYNFDQIQMLDLRRNYQRALANYLDPVPVAHIISYARPSYQKIYPKTMLSIMLAAMGTFFMSLLVISIVDRLPSKNT